MIDDQISGRRSPLVGPEDHIFLGDLSKALKKAETFNTLLSFILRLDHSCIYKTLR